MCFIGKTLKECGLGCFVEKVQQVFVFYLNVVSTKGIVFVCRELKLSYKRVVCFCCGNLQAVIFSLFCVKIPNCGSLVTEANI